jgi:hypothetical protein
VPDRFDEVADEAGSGSRGASFGTQLVDEARALALGL